MLQIEQFSLFAPQQSDPAAMPVVLSYGMGVDSTALLLRLILDPTSRDFPLENLVVITAMVGDEWPETAELVESVVLPLLRKYRIRFIQAARTGESQTEGVTILSDTRSPRKLYVKGKHSLSTHLLRNGIVPQRMKGRRLCTVHYKAFVIDAVVKLLFGDSPRRRFLGYNDDEKKRAENDQSFSQTNARYLIGYNADEEKRVWDESLLFGEQPYRYIIGFNADEVSRKKDDSISWRRQVFEFPLIVWGWGREKCEEFVRMIAGRPWRKSSCVYCPFSCSSGGRKLLTESYRQHPDLAGYAAFIEHVALAINPTQSLYDKKSVRDVLLQDGNLAALMNLQERLNAQQEWGVYHVRRMFLPAKKPDAKRQPPPNRSTKIIYKGSYGECLFQLENLATFFNKTPEYIAYSWRFWPIPRMDKTLRPALEEMYVVCPLIPVEKNGIDTFDQVWFDILNRSGINTTPNSNLFETPSEIASKRREELLHSTPLVDLAKPQKR